MPLIDLPKKALGSSAKVRRRRLAVMRYMLRGYTAHEAWDELQSAQWWEGWSINTVVKDMQILRNYIRAYGKDLPELREAMSWAISYYEDTMKEYDRLAKKYEAMEKYDLAARYRAMRDHLASKAFRALGISDLNLQISGGQQGGNAEAVLAFFGISTESAPEEKHEKKTKRRSDKRKNKSKSA